VNLGDTFVNLNPGLLSHFWMVISRETGYGWVIVNLTTYRLGCDESCLLGPNDHPWIRHRSSIEYRRAVTLTVFRLGEMVRLGMVAWKEPLRPETLRKVQEGAVKSKFFKNRFKGFIRSAIT